MKRAIVVGASSGIGRTTALQLAQAGWEVLVHGFHKVQQTQELADEIRQLGRQSAPLIADLSQPTQVKSLVEQAWAHWGGLDTWLHLAGADILTGSARLATFDEKLQMLWQVDVQSTITACRHVGQLMRAQGHGSIVTMGWDQAETGMDGDSGELFAATKGAVMAFTRSLSLSLAPTVRVNNVAPGWIKTAWGDSVLLLLITSGLAHLPPIKVVTILSGVVHVNLAVFTVSAIVARGARFFALAWALRRWGEPIRHLIEHRLGLIAGLAAAAIIVLYVVVKFAH